MSTSAPGLSEFDRMVSDLTARGFARSVAEAAVRAQYPNLAPAARFDVDADAIEDEHVEAGDKLMLALGFDVIRFSQKKAAKVTPGIPDRRFYHRSRRLYCWWEAKADWGRQSPAQRDYQDMCVASGDPYVLGGIDALREWLVVYKVATFDANWNPEPLPYTT